MVQTTEELIQHWKNKAAGLDEEARELAYKSSELRARATDLRGCADSLLDLERASKASRGGPDDR